MKTIKLLDCTLRDGGYVNDWEFGHSVITGTYKRLDAAGVDFIEVGFLDDRRQFDIERTIQPSTECYNVIFNGIEKKHAIPVAMIDFGTCDISNIADVNDSFVKAIRVIFKKEKIDNALPFCRAIKDKGYLLFIQAISITAYSDLDMLMYIQKINEIKPFAFSIVDTYGLLDNQKLINYYNLLNNNLDPSISIGYHAHNNFQLAFSNSIQYLALETNRTIVVDSTVYGMGKSAGNCPSELLSLHLNQHYGKSYDIDQFLEILDTDLLQVYQKHYWGYNYNFYISAMQNCHPNYVNYLLNKKTLAISAVNQILSAIPAEKKLLYDEHYIAQAYTVFQNHQIDDTQVINDLRIKLKGRDVLLLGPGRSLISERDSIQKEIQNPNLAVIAVNFYPKEYPTDYVFVSNAKRYSKLADYEHEGLSEKLIITSNITPFDIQPRYRVNYQGLFSKDKQQSDNALLLCIKLMIKIGSPEVCLAGFDGYSTGLDYYDARYSFANEHYRTNVNVTIAEGINELRRSIAIRFITKSLYE